MSIRMAIGFIAVFLAVVTPARADDEPVRGKIYTERLAGLVMYASKLRLDDRSLGTDGSWSSLGKADEGDPMHLYCDVHGAEGWPAPGDDPKIFTGVDQKGQLVKCDPARYFGIRNAPIRVVYVGYIDVDLNAQACPADYALPQLKVEQRERSTLLALQIRQLASKLMPSSPGTKAGTAPMLCAYAWPVVETEFPRADITVKVPEPQQPKNESTVRVISGPAEHWFLSGDVLVKGPTALSYDSSKKQLVQKDKPKQFLLGLNFMLGDVYSRLPNLTARRIVVKAFATPNRKLDTIGVGVGYRLPAVDFMFATKDVDSKDHSGFVLYVAQAWTKGDKLEGASVVEDSHRKSSTRLGISYSIGTALEMLK